MFKRNPSFLLLLTMLLAACGQPVDRTSEVGPEKAEILAPPENTCGNPALVDVQSLEGGSVGVFEVLNDEENLWLIFTPNVSFAMRELHLYIGPQAGIPKDGWGNYLPSEFPLFLKKESSSRIWTYHRPLPELPECFVVAASIQLSSQDEQENPAADLFPAWTRGTEPKKELHSIFYCPGSCALENVKCLSGTDPGQFRSLTQAAWQVALGKELYQNEFSEIFPEGLHLGCNTEVSFSDPEALQAALPMKGNAGAFSKMDKNPNSISNALAGEACALTLTLEFDQARENFSASPVWLGRLLVARGAFYGWQVSDLLAEANAVLGGCASNYSAGQMQEVLRRVNLNFAGGTTDEGFLRCP